MEKKYIYHVSPMEYAAIMNRTKCESCAKFCNGCSWTDGTWRPVEGWVATKTVHNNGYLGPYDSYHVKECPLYDCDVELKMPAPEPEKESGGYYNARPIYMMMRDGRFQLFDTISAAARWIDENEDLGIQLSAIRSAILKANNQPIDREYFFVKGHLFKKYGD